MQDVYHPLRGDTAFFCGEDCHRRFVAIKMRFKLPVVSIPQSKIHSGIPNAQGPLPSAVGLPLEPASDVQEATGKAQNDDPKPPSRQFCNQPYLKYCGFVFLSSFECSAQCFFTRLIPMRIFFLQLYSKLSVGFSPKPGSRERRH